jgi:hypothetical protein
VTPSREAIVFHRLLDGDEHRLTVPMPLTEDEDELTAVRRKLLVRVGTFERHPA